MRITRETLREIIIEQVEGLLTEQESEFVSSEAIDEILKGKLSDEGGAASFSDLQAALEGVAVPEDFDLASHLSGHSEISMHEDGDYVLSTGLGEGSMRITRETLREIIIEQIRQGGPEDLWAAEEGRPESDPSPFTDALEGDTQISSPELETAEAQAAKSVSDAFGREMIKLYENDPAMFDGYSTEEEWQQQVTYAQQDLDTGLSAAIAEVIEEIETSLHGGEYARMQIQMDLR